MKKRKPIIRAWAVVCPDGTLYGSPWRESDDAERVASRAHGDVHWQDVDCTIGCTGQHTVVELVKVRKRRKKGRAK